MNMGQYIDNDRKYDISHPQSDRLTSHCYCNHFLYTIYFFRLYTFPINLAVRVVYCFVKSIVNLSRPALHLYKSMKNVSNNMHT